VEKCLLDGNFTEAIVKCFNTPKANNFDYNLLEPLQKLLRLSPPVAASLARSDMYSGILQKLNHKKAVIRLNMLRIVRSVCDPNEEGGQDIRAHPLFDAIEGLAEKDGAVLVRNMASELVKSTLETPDREHEMSSGASRSRGNVRRQSSYPNSNLGLSSPSTPTHGGRANQSFGALLGGEGGTPRRSGLSIEPDSTIYRPRSREGPLVVGRTSSELLNGAPVLSKSRLPRTAALRPSRSSLAASSVRDTRSETAFGTGKRGERESGVGASASGDGQRVRSDPKQSSSSMSHLVSKRRPRAPSGDIKWS
jgi:hypothetical protein